MASYKHLKSEIKRFVGVTTVENAHIVDAQLDELLGNIELMAFVDKMCKKNGAMTTTYISFIIRNINAAYNKSYPDNLELEDKEFKKQAESIRSQYGENRPSLVAFFETIREYALKNHPGRV